MIVHGTEYEFVKVADSRDLAGWRSSTEKSDCCLTRLISREGSPVGMQSQETS